MHVHMCAWPMGRTCGLERLAGERGTAWFLITEVVVCVCARMCVGGWVGVACTQVSSVSIVSDVML